MKKKAAIEFSDGPTVERRNHTPFTRDVLTPLGAPIIARHRTRLILTPLSARRSILEDIAEKPEAVRLRSLRRRLTVLDRALSDREAEMLERLTSCINGLSNVGCVNYLKSESPLQPLWALALWREETTRNRRDELRAKGTEQKQPRGCVEPRRPPRSKQQHQQFKSRRKLYCFSPRGGGGSRDALR